MTKSFSITEQYDNIFKLKTENITIIVQQQSSPKHTYNYNSCYTTTQPGSCNFGSLSGYIINELFYVREESYHFGIKYSEINISFFC